MNMDEISRFRRISDFAARCGFAIVPSKWHASSVALVPTGEAYPILNRDNQVVVADHVESLEMWLRGILWMRAYLADGGWISEERILKDEELERARQLAIAMASDPEEDKIPF